MRIRFYVSHGPGREIKDRVWNIASALDDAARLFGDEFETVHNALFDGPAEGVDVACTWGVVGNAKAIIAGYTASGKRALMFDKALIRRLGNERQGHFRVGIDGPAPLKYLMRTLRSWERWEAQRVAVKPRQIVPSSAGRAAILFAGSSQKYCDFYGLGDANDYAESVFDRIREITKKTPLVYRPKPSWPGAREIAGTKLSGQPQPDGTAGRTLLRELKATGVLITHGSAAAVEAIVSGVPVIALGPCAASPVAIQALDDAGLQNLESLYFPSDAARFHWLCNLAWCQWTEAELRSGEAWAFLRGELAATSSGI